MSKPPVSVPRAMAHLRKAERAIGVAARHVTAARDELRGGPASGTQEALQQLADWLRTYRAEQGLSRSALARAAKLSLSSLKNLEDARYWPSQSTIDRLGKLGLPAALQAWLKTPA